MQEPKITKLKGGYSADVELMFQSWHADIEAHIVDRNLDNSAAVQLIKEHWRVHIMKSSINLTYVGGLLIIMSSLNILVSCFRGERMRQIFLWSSIVEHKSQRSLKKPLRMSSSCSPIR